LGKEGKKRYSLRKAGDSEVNSERVPTDRSVGKALTDRSETMNSQSGEVRHKIPATNQTYTMLSIPPPEFILEPSLGNSTTPDATENPYTTLSIPPPEFILEPAVGNSTTPDATPKAVGNSTTPSATPNPKASDMDYSI
jgi:hypothetical protein